MSAGRREVDTIVVSSAGFFSLDEISRQHYARGVRSAKGSPTAFHYYIDELGKSYVCRRVSEPARLLRGFNDQAIHIGLYGEHVQWPSEAQLIELYRVTTEMLHWIDNTDANLYSERLLFTNSRRPLGPVLDYNSWFNGVELGVHRIGE